MADNNQVTTIVSKDIPSSRFTFDKLVKMRQAFPGEDDESLARYLIGKGDDLEKALEQYDRYVQWRRSNWPILKSCCLKEFNTGKMYVRGFDLEGRPILVYRTRLSFPKERDLTDAIHNMIWWSEYAMSKLPKEYTKFTILIDRTDHKSENTDMDLLKQTANVFSDIFCERLNKCIIYPADFLFYAVWNLAKWFLDPNTRGKVVPVLYLSGVEQLIAREHIPKAMGGDDDYEFNPEDYQDFYPIEEVEKAMKEREDAKAAKHAHEATTSATSPTTSETPETVFTGAAKAAEEAAAGEAAGTSAAEGDGEATN